MKKLLIIDDEREICELLSVLLSSYGYVASCAFSAKEAREKLVKDRYDLILSDIHLPGGSGLSLAQDFSESGALWGFMTGNFDAALIQKAAKLGPVHILIKPFGDAEIKQFMKKLESAKQDPIFEIMGMVNSISGIKLGPEKRTLVETRLLRRAGSLGIKTVEGYMEYFRANRSSELEQIISSLSTHTTSFFRESDHFDFFLTKFLPTVASNKVIRIWSAASSIGAEAYTIAMVIDQHFIRKGVPDNLRPKVEIYGSDIDFASVDYAKQGIYSSREVSGIRSNLLKEYFDAGGGELKGLFRVKDKLHDWCSFQQLNLFDRTYPLPHFDAIFLRNILIYFTDEDIEKVVKKVLGHLKPKGMLFVGHSESLGRLGSLVRPIGNCIYGHLDIGTEPSPAASSGKIKTLIVDDSQTIRTMLRSILEGDSKFEVVGDVEDPIEAAEFLKSNAVDVMTLDLEMPRMTGHEYLQKIKPDKSHPPVVVISSISFEHADAAVRCLELGAADYIEKPRKKSFNLDTERIRMVLESIACSHRRRPARTGSMVSSSPRVHYSSSGNDLIVLGASTGGVIALKELLSGFPKSHPPVVIVQHIPPVFSQTFAERLGRDLGLCVREASHGDQVEGSCIYIAPGGKQLRIVEKGPSLYLEVTDDPPVNRHKPSVDYMFESVDRLKGKYNIASAILTGMGGDGARGLKALRDRGAYTIAQDEATSVVYGMPRVAVEMNAAVDVLPLDKIADSLLRFFERPSAGIKKIA